MVVGHDFGRQARAVGEIDQDLSRLLDEIESTGDDVAIGRNDQAGRRAGADQHVANRRSNPPSVSMRTTLGATRSTAAFIAASSRSGRSSWEKAEGGRRKAESRMQNANGRKSRTRAMTNLGASYSVRN